MEAGKIAEEAEELAQEGEQVGEEVEVEGGEEEEEVEKWTEEELRRLGQTDLTALLLAHEQHVGGPADESIRESLCHRLTPHR